MKRTQQMDAVERVYESDLSEVDLLGDEYQTVGKLMTTGTTSLLWIVDVLLYINLLSHNKYR